MQDLIRKLVEPGIQVIRLQGGKEGRQVPILVTVIPLQNDIMQEHPCQPRVSKFAKDSAYDRTGISLHEPVRPRFLVSNQ